MYKKGTMSQYRDDAEKGRIYSPPHNAGLYSGEPFKAGAPWAPVPVAPDSGYLVHENLRASHPYLPAEAYFQYPGDTRVGNNYSAKPGVRPQGPRQSDVMCVDPTALRRAEAASVTPQEVYGKRRPTPLEHRSQLTSYGYLYEVL